MEIFTPNPNWSVRHCCIGGRDALYTPALIEDPTTQAEFDIEIGDHSAQIEVVVETNKASADLRFKEHLQPH